MWFQDFKIWISLSRSWWWWGGHSLTLFLQLGNWLNLAVSLTVLGMTHGKNPSAVEHFQENPVGTHTYYHPLSLTPPVKTLAPKGINAQQPERQGPDRRETVTVLSTPWMVL